MQIEESKGEKDKFFNDTYKNKVYQTLQEIV
jgi:hypothetical protein